MNLVDQFTDRLSTPRVHRFTREEYYQLAEIGFFGGKRVELIDGEILEMAPQRNDHAVAVELAVDALRAVFAAGYRVRVQLPFGVADGTEPEPDLAVFHGSPRDSRDHPTQALLIVEISDTTLGYDRGVKSHLYAAAGVLDYWIVNLPGRCVEVYRHPTPDTASGQIRYAPAEIFIASKVISPLALPRASIAVADLLP